MGVWSGIRLFTVLFYSFPCMAFAYSDLSGLPLISVFPFSSGSPFFSFFIDSLSSSDFK